MCGLMFNSPTFFFCPMLSGTLCADQKEIVTIDVSARWNIHLFLQIYVNYSTRMTQKGKSQEHTLRSNKLDACNSSIVMSWWYDHQQNMHPPFLTEFSSEVWFMSAHINLSGSKGKISPINMGCLWNTNDALTLHWVLLQAFSNIHWAEWQKNREKGHERDQREREYVWQELQLEGEQTSKMKQGERGDMKRMTMSEVWKEWHVEKCGIHRENEHKPRISLTNVSLSDKKKKTDRILRCFYVRVISVVEAGVIDPGEWCHGVHKLARVGI